MSNFIKDIVEGRIDDWTHRKFVRYSLGEFEKEQFIIKVSGSGVQIKAGYEYLDSIFKLMADLVDSDVSLNGVIQTTKDIFGELKEIGIEPEKVTGKKYTINSTITKDQFKKLVEKLSNYYLLLNLKSGDYSVSSKKSLPKPGNLGEKFLTAKFPVKDLKTVKDTYLFDANADKFKEAVIKHRYIIDSIDVDEKLVKSDPEKSRLEAKRVGRIIREITIDGKAETKEIKINV